MVNNYSCKLFEITFNKVRNRKYNIILIVTGVILSVFSLKSIPFLTNNLTMNSGAFWCKGLQWCKCTALIYH